MKQDKSTNELAEPFEITEEEYKEFLSANGEEQWKILLSHAKKNRRNITSKKIQENKNERNRNQKSFQELSRNVCGR